VGSATKHLGFRILGPVEGVELDRTIALGGPLQRAVLAIPLLQRGEVVTGDRLIDELWGERPPATVAKTLQRGVEPEGVRVTKAD